MRGTANLLRHGVRLTAPSPASSRSFHTCNAALKPTGSTSEIGASSLSSRWLSDLKAKAQENMKGGRKVQDSERVLDQLGDNWVELVAGSEGFLSGPQWAGLSKETVRWGDMDSMVCHVNNIMYNRFAESSRVNYFRHFGDRAATPELKQEWDTLMTPRGVGLILKSIKTDYKFPLVFPDAVTVLHKLLTKPTSDTTSIDFEVVILSHDHQRPAARCFEDVVVYDYRAGKKASMKPFMVDEFSAAYDLQEATRKKAIDKILTLQKTID